MHVSPARYRRFGSSDLVASIIERIDTLIAKGVLVAGQRLVESDLMQMLGVGRVPVREALRILAGDGVVELSPNRSARLRALGPERLAQMQSVFEPLFQTAIELFAQTTPTPEAIAALRNARDRINAAQYRGSAQDILDAILAFHQVTVDYSGNDFLAELIARMHVPLFRRELADAIGLPALMDVAGIYGGMADALADGDPAAAVTAMAPHLSRFRALLVTKAASRRY